MVYQEQTTSGCHFTIKFWKNYIWPCHLSGRKTEEFWILLYMVLLINGSLISQRIKNIKWSFNIYTDGAVDHPLGGRAVAGGFGVVWRRWRNHILHLAHVHVGWWGWVRLLWRWASRQMEGTPHLTVSNLQELPNWNNINTNNDSETAES